MKKTVPEPNAELLSAEEVHDDVMSLQSALEQRKAERQAYNILERPQIKKMLSQVIASGVCANEAEAIERALKTLVTAVSN
ncbi:MAG: hypothetical protein EBE86_013345 [Hormoscilla sp. GUM202]|nr:hypothetical protein [Hormoscilla sp. GM7CHS1pb]MBO1348304.1 hypothetical protein [Hormoscilla sp. GUM202]